MLDLTKFCDDGSNPNCVRPYLQTPFTRGEFSYATNGYVAVRVPRLDSIEERDQPDVSRLQFDVAAPFVPLSPFGACVIVGSAPWVCDECKGTGKIVVCKHCDGEGSTECCECGNDKECDRCEGAGSRPSREGDCAEDLVECEECEGEGTTRDGTPDIHGRKVGARWYDVVYLELIASLPGIVVADEPSPDMLRFRFDGGHGLLMPLRMPKGDEIREAA